MLTTGRRGIPSSGDAARNVAERWAAEGAVAAGSEEALARLELTPGERPTADSLERVLRGRSAESDAKARGSAKLGTEAFAWLDGRDRPPGGGSGIVHFEVSARAPAEVHASWSGAPADQRATIDAALLDGAVRGAERILAEGGHPARVALLGRVREVELGDGEKALEATALVVGVDRDRELLMSPSPARGRLSDAAMEDASAAARATFESSVQRRREQAGAAVQASAAGVSAPVADAPVPATEAPAPAANAPAPAPAAEGPAPATEAPAPVADAPVPATGAPAPAVQAPAPAVDAPASAVQAPVVDRSRPTSLHGAESERRVRYLQGHLRGYSSAFVRVELMVRESAGNGAGPDQEQRLIALRREHERRGLEPLPSASAGLERYRGLLGERAARLIDERAGRLADSLGDRARDRRWLAEARDRLGDPLRPLADAAAASEIDATLGRDRLVEWWRGGGADKAARSVALEGQIGALDRELQPARQAQVDQGREAEQDRGDDRRAARERDPADSGRGAGRAAAEAGIAGGGAGFG